MINVLFFGFFFICCLTNMLVFGHFIRQSRWPDLEKHYASPSRLYGGDDVTVIINSMTVPSTIAVRNATLYVSAYLRYSLLFKPIAIPLHRLRKVGLVSGMFVELMKFNILAPDDTVLTTLQIRSDAKLARDL